MKHSFAILLLLLTSMIATSCWKVDEDWSLCEEILVVDMSLDGVPDSRFTDHIDVVDIYLFDADLKLLQTRKLSSAMLDESLETSFELDHGTYYVVCWANVGSNTRISSTEGHILDSHMELVSSETGDPLYYAPKKTPEIYPESKSRAGTGEPDYSIYMAEVVAGTVTTKEMVFTKAHRTVEVFIEGWELLELPGAPAVERNGAGGRYDFLLRADVTNLLRFRRSTHIVTVDGTEYYRTLFHSALLPLEDYPGSVMLTDPATGDVPDTEVDLAEYVAQKEIEDDSYIPIYYKFKDENGNGDGVSVHIDLPPWEEHNIHW